MEQVCVKEGGEDREDNEADENEGAENVSL